MALARPVRVIIYGDPNGERFEAVIKEDEVELWSHQLRVTRIDTNMSQRLLGTVPRSKFLEIARMLEAMGTEG